jgi:hypothetical protein
MVKTVEGLVPEIEMFAEVVLITPPPVVTLKGVFSAVLPISLRAGLRRLAFHEL